MHLLPNVNHMLLEDPDGGGRSWLSFPVKRMSTEVLRLVSDWVARVSP